MSPVGRLIDEGKCFVRSIVIPMSETAEPSVSFPTLCEKRRREVTRSHETDEALTPTKKTTSKPVCE